MGSRAPRRVLVVEDNEELAENITEIFLGGGYDSRMVHSGEAALQCMQTERFDTMVTDLRLPGISGLDLIVAMRAKGTRTPAIVISAFADDATVKRAGVVGALDVLPKPLDFDRLFALVESVERVELGSRAPGSSPP